MGKELVTPFHALVQILCCWGFATAFIQPVHGHSCPQLAPMNNGHFDSLVGLFGVWDRAITRTWL